MSPEKYAHIFVEEVSLLEWRVFLKLLKAWGWNVK